MRLVSIAVVVSCLAVSMTAVAEESSAVAPTSSAARALVNRWVTAINSGDRVAYLNCYVYGMPDDLVNRMPDRIEVSDVRVTRAFNTIAPRTDVVLFVRRRTGGQWVSGERRLVLVTVGTTPRILRQGPLRQVRSKNKAQGTTINIVGVRGADRPAGGFLKSAVNPNEVFARPYGKNRVAPEDEGGLLRPGNGGSDSVSDIGPIERPDVEARRPGSRLKRGPLRRVDGPRFLVSSKLRHVLGRVMGGVRNCYERALLARPTLTGRVDLRFVIGSDGRVSSITTTHDTVAPAVAKCINNRIAGLRFPPAEKGPETFRQTIFLAPAE